MIPGHVGHQIDERAREQFRATFRMFDPNVPRLDGFTVQLGTDLLLTFDFSFDHITYEHSLTFHDIDRDLRPGTTEARLRYELDNRIHAIYQHEAGQFAADARMMRAIERARVDFYDEMEFSRREIDGVSTANVAAPAGEGLTVEAMQGMVNLAVNQRVTYSWMQREAYVQAVVEAAGYNPAYFIVGPTGEFGTEEAQKRGLDLLVHWLSPEQRAQFEKDRSFEVTGQSGTRYRIRYGRSMNIDLLDADGKETSQRVCFAPVGPLVTGDVMLAQKLALETNEAEALRVANRSIRDDGFFFVGDIIRREPVFVADLTA